jgi:hypothetical protein
VSHATEDVAALEDGPAYEIVSVLHDDDGTANAQSLGLRGPVCDMLLAPTKEDHDGCPDSAPF